MKKFLLDKTLVIGVIVLLVGVSVYPAIANEPISTVNVSKDEEIGHKEYLFQTIIDICNNPNVKELFSKYNNDIIDSEYNSIRLFFKILFKKPKLLFSIFFCKPEITYKSLESIYSQGVELINVLGKNEVIKIIESVEITNTEFFNEFNNTIMNDEALFNRITTLKEMNEGLKFGTSSEKPICDLLIAYALVVIKYILLPLLDIFTEIDNVALFILCVILWVLIAVFTLSPAAFGLLIFGCYDGY